MDYRILGRSGARVSTICLGTMNFGDAADEAESHRILDAAREAGINFTDTANNYTQQRSETIIGRWFAQGGGRREETLLATKVHRTVGPGPNGGGNHRYTVMLRVEESLRRLQTDHIDLYYFHRPDPLAPVVEQVAVMQDLVRQGKVRYFATSHYPAWMILQGMWDAEKLGGPAWVADQPEYSLVAREIEGDLVPFCLATGYGLVPHSPLAGGFLTGKYKRGEPPPPNTRGEVRPALASNRTDAEWSALDRLSTAASDAGCSTAQAAIAWVLAQPAVTSTIIGPRSVEQLRDNIAAMDVRLLPEALAKLGTT